VSGRHATDSTSSRSSSSSVGTGASSGVAAGTLSGSVSRRSSLASGAGSPASRGLGGSAPGDRREAAGREATAAQPPPDHATAESSAAPPVPDAVVRRSGSELVGLDEFTEVVRQIDDFFGNVAELPEWTDDERGTSRRRCYSGSSATLPKKSSIWRTTSVNWSKSTGLETWTEAWRS
jgi:hypothetical protein